MGHVWIREEKNPYEKRSFLIPAHAGLLIAAGHKVSVEHSSKRIYSDAEYEKVGCQIVPTNSWREAPLDAYILAIKGLAVADDPIHHTHLCFAYAYDNQKTSQAMRERFQKGKGMLLDLEFLINSIGVSQVTKSAGFYGGVCGAAVSLNIYYQKKANKHFPFSIPFYYDHFDDLIHEMQQSVKLFQTPTVLIIGANGMVGKGAQHLLKKLNIPYKNWYREHTNKKEVLSQIVDFNIVLNCISVGEDTPIFLTKKILQESNYEISVIGDICCDPTSDQNPLPLYDKPTTFPDPTIQINAESSKPIDLMSIDHVTSLLPRESSQAMSFDLLPHLCVLLMAQGKLENTLWDNCKKEFNKHIKR
jgi:alanine dehydrogenase